MPWLVILAILAGFFIKWLVTNQSAKQTTITSFKALNGRIKELFADGGIRFREKIDELFEYIFFLNKK